MKAGRKRHNPGARQLVVSRPVERKKDDTKMTASRSKITQNLRLRGTPESSPLFKPKLKKALSLALSWAIVISIFVGVQTPAFAADTDTSFSSDSYELSDKYDSEPGSAAGDNDEGLCGDGQDDVTADVIDFTQSHGGSNTAENKEPAPEISAEFISGAAIEQSAAMAISPSETTAAETVYGGDTITQGGEYSIGRNTGYVQGTITISTTDPVTLIGTGISGDDIYESLYINCVVDGVTLILKDVYIYNTDYAANMINFRGVGNYLYFGGVSILDMNTGATGYAMIHVNADTSLTIGGLTDDDTLYFYKREQGAGIGGNGSNLMPEYNGDITITGGRFFMKNSKQGALFGSGAGVGGSATGSPGDIVILGGELNLLPISRGAAIGGSAGSSGGARGADVYIYSGANINFNVDYSGAAIGGGGYDAGNDADGGVLHYYGGSIRTFIDYNAVDPNGNGSFDTLWPGVTAPGVNDTALTAAKRDDAGDPVYLFVFDTEQLSASALYFTVNDGGKEIYSGGLHRWSFINENLHKDAQFGVDYTVDNWAPLDDTNLYLYLTADRHELTVNGEAFTAIWDNTAREFTILKGQSYTIEAVAGAGGSLTPDKTEAAAGETITVTVTTEEDYRFVSGSLKINGTVLEADENGVFSFVMPAEAVTLTAEFEKIAADAEKYAITISGAGEGGVITADKTEAAEGEAVEVTVTQTSGYQLVPGSLKQNGVEIVESNGLYSFLMPSDDVTITAEFELIGFDEPNGALFENGKAQDYVVSIEKGYELFDAAKGVTVNGSKLSSGSCSVTEGSTIVTISKTYINSLTNGVYIVIIHFADGTEVIRTFEVATGVLFSITVTPGISGGVITADKYTAREGETVTVTVTPNSGKRFVAGSLQWDGRVINPDAAGKFTFVMPAWHVTLTALFTDAGGDFDIGTGDINAPIWDGKSIDIRWFTDNPGASSYTLYTPAELAGLAALVNGLYNTGIDTKAGEVSYIRVNTGLGDESGPQGNNKSTATYHYGDYNFTGKTIYLGADINMGNSNNYMPIGGQYLMTPNDSTTRIDSSFCGVFDGQGHTVTLNTDRHCSTGDYGDGQSVGLIGRIGVHDNDPASLRPSGAAVRNVAVRGAVRANRSVGGIVGKIGKTVGGVDIENCANFASVSSTDAKGVGGIVGAAWNGGVIRNCYNTGSVSATHTNPAGGIAGSVEILIENCYSVGNITAPTGYAMAIGTNNGGATQKNNYYLAGSAPDGGWYSSGSSNKNGERTSEYMKSDDFVHDLGDAFRKDTGNINNGYPVLTWQGGGTVIAGDNTDSEDEMTEIEVEVETIVEDGSATVVVEDIDVPLGSAPTIYVITVDTQGEDVNDVTAEITIETLKKVADSGSALRIDSPLGSLTLPNEALKTIVGGNKGTLSIIIEKLEDGGTEFKFTVDGKTIGTIISGVIVTIPVPDSLKVPLSSTPSDSSGLRPELVVVIVGADGIERVIRKSLVDNNNARFILNGDTTVRIIANAKSFSDVRGADWFYGAVNFATARELFLGTSDTAFSPNSPMTRAMLATVLWRLEDNPYSGQWSVASVQFGDVKDGAYYADAVAWASANGIVEGYGNGVFGSADNITREQLAVMLYRYYQSLELRAENLGDVGDGDNSPLSTLNSQFSDADRISTWAVEAMNWAVSEGIITGVDDAALAPQGMATRAQVATMLMRFADLIIK